MKYAIKTSWLMNRVHTDGYITLTPEVTITQQKPKATVFQSQALCQGWLLKVQVLFPSLKFKVVEL